jgi:hypothetical protein
VNFADVFGCVDAAHTRHLCAMQAVYTERSGLLFLSTKQDAQRRVVKDLAQLKN